MNALQTYGRGSPAGAAAEQAKAAAFAIVPDLDMAGRERTAVAGEVPNPLNPPSGCAFHPRCPLANDRCRSERPLLKLHGETSVACHAVEEGRAA